MPTLKEQVEAFERDLIVTALRDHCWKRQATADSLGISRITLHNKMKRYEINTEKDSWTAQRQGYLK